jgi:hypothetical protein
MTRRARAVLVALVGSSLVLGCRGDSAASNDDRSGYATEWRAEETLRIGSVDDPDQALVSIPEVSLGADGRIYVGQARDLQIRVYSPDGRLLTRIGRKGEGPGELMSINSIGLRGDTLYVSDFRLQRLSFFAPDGTFLTSQQWASTRIDGGAVRGGMATLVTGAPQVLLPDGSGLSEPGLRISVSGAGPTRPPSVTTTPRMVVRATTDASTLDTVLKYEVVGRTG